MLSKTPLPYNPLVIALIAAVLFLPFLGNVHLFDWDEINFAESAREMLLTGDYRRVQIDFKLFWEKPPLFFWMQTLSMRLFGINEYAARFPNAVFGILTCLTLYYIGKKHYHKKFGIIWAMSYMGSVLPHFYFKSGIIDPVFNYFIFIGIYFLACTIAGYRREPTTGLAALSGLAVGLAILTKGPVGLLVPMLTFLVYWAINGFRAVSRFGTLLLFTLCVAAVSFLWFGLDVIENGPWFIKEFIVYQIELFTQPVAGHGQPFYYHFVVVLIGCFPVSILALRSFVYKGADNSPFLRQWMLIMFWVVMILFSLSTTKIVHYSSLSYFPLTFLSAYHLYALIEGKLRWNTAHSVAVLVFGLLISLVFAALPLAGMNIEKIIPLLKDDFAVANFSAKVDWYWYEALFGIAYFVAVVVAVIHFARHHFHRAVNILFLSTAVCLFFVLVLLVPKVEKYTQGAVINFYERMQGKDVYVHVTGFKSYAHLFYFRKPAVVNEKSRDEEWLINGQVDKPVYLITKVDRKEKLKELRSLPHLKEVESLNGFVVFYRDKPGL